MKPNSISQSDRAVVQTLCRLIEFDSVSSKSNVEISDWVGNELKRRGFAVSLQRYDDARGVAKANVIGRRLPSDSITRSNDDSVGGLVYLCHTDVVPANTWTGPGPDPFVPVLQDNRLYGRGSCDMKGSLAAMLSAIDRFDASDAAQRAPLSIIATADEEVGFDGARHVARDASVYAEIVAEAPIAVVGEPTRLRVVHGHKGIHGFDVVSRGLAVHSSRDDGENANWNIIPVLQLIREIREETLRDDSMHHQAFDPQHLSWNMVVNTDCVPMNVTQGLMRVSVSYRTMPGIDGAVFAARVAEACKARDLDFVAMPGCDPVLNEVDNVAVKTMLEICQQESSHTVCYGTDGGIFFRDLPNMVVCGPGDIAQAHKTDEWICLDQLAAGVDVYERAIHRCCA
ncbi:MAG: M20/M25/M40 family metallo-hydrolase [Planctomycetota bacterium]